MRLTTREWREVRPAPRQQAPKPRGLPWAQRVTLTKLAKAAGIAPSTISRWANRCPEIRQRLGDDAFVRYVLDQQAMRYRNSRRTLPTTGE